MNKKITVDLPSDYHSMVDPVLRRNWVRDDTGAQHPVDCALDQKEADVLAQIILDHGCKRCLETGVAKGISTLAITQAVARLGGHHTGIDPYQSAGHRNAAIELLAEHGLKDHFTLLEGPSHLMMPPLLAQKEEFDFIFIDGMHSFQYKLLDYFYADQLLKVGGWLVFHDLVLASVKKVFRFVRNEGKYEAWSTPTLEPSLLRKTRYAVAATLKGRSLSTFWPNGFSNVLVLRKISAEERRWDYFKSF